MNVTVGYLVGSISPHSINRSLAMALKGLGAEAELALEEIPIAGLPMYSSDLDGDYPEIAVRFKERIRSVDAVVIVTPEFNRSVPGVLKNALDVASRPFGDNAFEAKPSAVIGASTGAIGTAVAQQHLRSILSFLASPEMAQPEAYVQLREGQIDQVGNVLDAGLRQRLLVWLVAVRAHAVRMRRTER